MMSDKNTKLFEMAEENEEANTLACKCIEFIDASGGIFCSPDGVKKVANILIEYCDKINNTEKTGPIKR